MQFTLGAIPGLAPGAEAFGFSWRRSAASQLSVRHGRDTTPQWRNASTIVTGAPPVGDYIEGRVFADQKAMDGRQAKRRLLKPQVRFPDDLAPAPASRGHPASIFFETLAKQLLSPRVSLGGNRLQSPLFNTDARTSARFALKSRCPVSICTGRPTRNVATKDDRDAFACSSTCIRCSE